MRLHWAVRAAICLSMAAGSIVSPLAFSAAAASSAELPEASLILPGGSKIALMVLTEVSSQRARPGDVVKLRVAEPVSVDGVTVVPPGTPVFGTVMSSTKSGAALQRGQVAVDISSLVLPSGTVKLTGNFHRTGTGGKNDDLVKTVLAPMYVLFSPGNSGKLKAGEVLTVTTEGDHHILRPAILLQFPGNGGSSSGPLSGSSTSGASGTTSGGSR